ncbi:hypothetical protein PLICRDRAFT_314672 [Plicaturopsis crispa FD-325 SS-3]|nr:hypothetical protein PLICRDRAFT_314672 [Plicaturopsis crispa FD-325 SS-3]
MRVKLFDLLDIAPPFPRPKMWSPTTASSTRDVAAFEYGYDLTERLDGIVYQQTLASQLLVEARELVDHLEIDDQIPEQAWWYSKVSPKKSHSGMPNKVHSEADSRKWFEHVFSFPALCGIRAFCSDSLDEASNPFEIWPVIKSCHGKRSFPTPDLVLVQGWIGVLEEIDVATIELKTDNSLPLNLFIDIQDPRIETDELGSIVVPFDWPVDDGTPVPKQTRILVQVFSQMIKYKVQYAILSSYIATTFFYLERIAEKNILYISETYDSATLTPALVFSWMAGSLGLIPNSEFALSKPNMSYMHGRLPEWSSCGPRIDIVDLALAANADEATPKAPRKIAETLVRLRHLRGDGAGDDSGMDTTPTKAGRSRSTARGAKRS